MMGVVGRVGKLGVSVRCNRTSRYILVETFSFRPCVRGIGAEQNVDEGGTGQNKNGFQHYVNRPSLQTRAGENGAWNAGAISHHPVSNPFNLLFIFAAFLCFSCSTVRGNAQPLTSKTDTLAEKVLRYQLPNGGWPKQLHDKSVVDYTRPITPALEEKIRATDVKHATLDNKATTREIRILIAAYTETKNAAYLLGAQRGIQYLLDAQYENGGFPQYYPATSLYRAQITFNDGAMINALEVLDDVARARPGYEVVNAQLRERAKIAVAKGIDCILRLQVRQGDRLTIWAAQYDEKTLEPAQARAYEPASLVTSESVGIVRFLMKQSPSPAVQRSVHAAVQWFKDHDIEGYRFDTVKDTITGKMTRTLVRDDSVNSWARFYDIENNKPLFGDRDNSVTYDFNDVSEERRHGYAWFGTWPQKLIDREYPKWLERVEKEKVKRKKAKGKSKKAKV